MAYEAGTIIEDAQGNRFVRQGRDWVPAPSRQEQMRADALAQVARDTGPVEAFLVGAGRALGGGYLFPGGDDAFAALQQQSPWATGLGQVAPALVGGVGTGLATAGLGTGARIGATALAEAGMGALGDPENPLQSAALGAVLGGGAMALPVLARGAGRAAEAAGLGMQNARAMAGVLPLPQRVQQRILGIAGEPGAAGAGRLPGGARTAPDFVGPPEPGGQGGAFFGLDEAMARGLPLTPGDQAYLAARSDGELALARNFRSAEELRRSHPELGAGINNVRDGQRQWITDRVAAELDLPAGTRLTPDVLGDKFDELGRVFDDVARVIGEVPISKGRLGELEGLQMDARLAYQGQLGRVHGELERILNRNEGMLTGADLAHLKVQLDKMMTTATRQGDHAMLADAQEYFRVLQDAMLENAPDELRGVLQDANRQYGLLKRLTQTAQTVDAEGVVNVQTLYNNFGRNPSRYKNAREDDLLRSLQTLRFLQTRLTPTSGTAERMLMGMANRAPALGVGALGAMAAGNWLFGG